MQSIFLSGLYKWKKSDEIHVLSLLDSFTEGLQVNIEEMMFLPGLIDIKYKGSDEEIFKNFIKKKFYEAVLDITRLEKYQRVRGVLVKSDTKSLILDIGVREPSENFIVIPKRILNVQLADGLNLTMEKLIKIFCLVPYICLEVDIIAVKPKLVAEMSCEQVRTFKRWKLIPLTRMIISGSLETNLRKTLDNLKLGNKVIRFKTLTLATHLLECRFCDDPNSIVNAIQSNLENCKVTLSTLHLYSY